jgi:hypothetical protein
MRKKHIARQKQNRWMQALQRMELWYAYCQVRTETQWKQRMPQYSLCVTKVLDLRIIFTTLQGVVWNAHSMEISTACFYAISRILTLAECIITSQEVNKNTSEQLRSVSLQQKKNPMQGQP